MQSHDRYDAIPRRCDLTMRFHDAMQFAQCKLHNAIPRCKSHDTIPRCSMMQSHSAIIHTTESAEWNLYDVIPRCNSTMQSTRCDLTMQSAQCNPTIQSARCDPTMQSHNASAQCVLTMQSHDAISRCNPHDEICAMQSHKASDPIKTIQSKQCNPMEAGWRKKSSDFFCQKDQNRKR